MESVLNKINSPKDLKQLTLAEKETLAEEIRAAILKRVNTIGGHLGPDLGFTEATIALHSVFNSPVDRLVLDVSHQCYPHKMLTGRKDGFLHPEDTEISGYFNPSESEHDKFIIGHTSTSVSLACGLAKARDVKGEDYNVIAVIGDGSLSGGEAFEGLDNAAAAGTGFIVVVNDNEMSIAENVGSLYDNLKELRETGGKAQNNFFKALGYDYFYEENGNDIAALINVFEKVKDCKRPTVVHIHTLKGKGYTPAVEDKERFHWSMPGFLEGKQYPSGECYDSITTDFLLKKIEEDKTVVVVNPATPGAVGFSKDFRAKAGKNYVDTGIAEEHAVAYVSALAKDGCKPVLAVLSSFVQRTYDQLSQDLALNNSPATILVYWGGISSADATHTGVFDIPMISNIPGIVFLAPTNKEEYLAMLEYSLNQTEHPVVIRVPFGEYVVSGEKDTTDYSILNKWKTVKSGSDVAILGVGNMFPLAEKTVEKLKENGIDATLINPRFLSGIDEDSANALKSTHKVVVTLESGVLAGGFGEKVASFFGSSDVKVLNYGQKREFTDRVPMPELVKRYRLTPELIAEDVMKLL
ncbi:MAG: 1-deoxy-D-xylulose-5-phosphate synthase [Candidatus Gastranaerophilaceae bacterium]